MDWFWGLLGASLIACTMVDALWTTVTPHGAGPGTGRLGRAIYGAARALGGGSAPGWAGAAVLVSAIVWWTAGLWLGWTLVFSVDPMSIVDPKTNAPADFVSRAYAVGTYLSTLGLGALWAPGTGGWGVLAAVVAVNGFAVLTLGVTYVLQVVVAVTGARQVASVVHTLGATPDEIVTRAWTGSGFDGLSQHLANLLPLVEAHGRRHKSYPALHFFHSRDRRTAAPVMLTVLDEALLLLAEGVAESERPAPAEVEPLRRTLGAYLDTLHESFVQPADNAPPAPSTRSLAAAGIPVVSDERLAQAAREEAGRRRRLLGLVRDAGRSWDAVTTP